MGGGWHGFLVAPGMKKIILSIVIAAGLTACSNQPKQVVVVVDTMAIKQQAIAAEQARVQAEQRTKDSIQAIRSAEARAMAKGEAKAERRTYTTMSQNADLGEPQAAPAAAKKKGWSDAAKGTLIGTGVGALGGALIDKNHARGAIIGGVVGAGTGYVVGRAKDRKTGRVVKKPQ